MVMPRKRRNLLSKKRKHSKRNTKRSTKTRKNMRKMRGGGEMLLPPPLVILGNTNDVGTMDYIHYYYISNKIERDPVLENGVYSLKAYDTDTGMLTLKNMFNVQTIDVDYHRIRSQCLIQEKTV